MLNKYFKETMDHLGIQGAALAEAVGCSRTNISQIRNGRVNPPIDKFWDLVEACESLCPGFRREFGIKVSGSLFVDADTAVSSADSQDLSKILFAIANKLEKERLTSENTDARSNGENLTLKAG